VHELYKITYNIGEEAISKFLGKRITATPCCNNYQSIYWPNL